MDNTDKRERQLAAGRWLRETRQRRGFDTAKSFAQALDLDSSAVSRMETGVYEIDDERAIQIARVLELPIVEVRRGLGLWVPTDEWVERLADQTLGYDLDALRTNVLELLDHVDEILRRHVGEPDKVEKRAKYRRAIARGGPDVEGVRDQISELPPPSQRRKPG